MTDTPPPQRSIRSFVRRTGRITPSQEKALAQLWPVFGLAYSHNVVDLAAVFRRPGPLVLEIGFGNGDTLVQQALECPELNFLGVEVHKPGVGHCLLRADDCGVSNLRLIAHDAIEVLNEQVAVGSLARVNLYFPDPWPKKRHHKRRIVQPDFLELVADRLMANGTLHIATDWANYAEHIDDVVSTSSRFAISERREHDGEHPLDRPRTKFEQRGLRKGHRIVDWCLVRSS
jgi:tRNA (guanine-N7-)-methyltransferase